MYMHLYIYIHTHTDRHIHSAYFQGFGVVVSLPRCRMRTLVSHQLATLDFKHGSTNKSTQRHIHKYKCAFEHKFEVSVSDQIPVQK